MNGNKRLSLVITMTFFYQNGGKHIKTSKETYKKWFLENFPNYKCSNSYNFETDEGWAFYHLNKAMASSVEKFEKLKKTVISFFQTFTEMSS